jgi:uncharacterized protein (DUF983 family)
MNKEKKRLYITSFMTNKCPRCRQGNLFQTNKAYDLKNNLTMNEHCPVCGQASEIEVGFYYGTGYVSYALSVAFLIATFVAWWILFGISFSDNSVFWWLGVSCTLLILLQPPMMRISRSLWLSWFVKYDPNWKNHTIESNERMLK